LWWDPRNLQIIERMSKGFDGDQVRLVDLGYRIELNSRKAAGAECARVTTPSEEQDRAI
jgi:hypothetical protein